MFYPSGNSATSGTVWFLYIGNSRKPSDFYHFYNLKRHSQIFNSQRSSSALMDYKGRTSLVPGRKNCSLKIDPVRREDGGKFYFPGIAEDLETNALAKGGRILWLHVTDAPSTLELTGSAEVVEGHPKMFACSVVHTCGSDLPSLKWNKPGQTMRQSEDLSGGKWREVFLIRFIPSHEDDKTEIQCTATYHNGITSYNATTLNIRYPPKAVTVNFPKNKEFLEGTDVILTCSCRSNPPPQRYEWYQAKSKMKIRFESRRLILQNVSKDTEPYSCAAINTIGRGESPPTEIPVQYAATGVQVIVLHPTEGATELKCSFLSSHPNVTRYTWIKDGDILLNKTEQILVLDSDEYKSGSYSCIAHNTAGSSTSAELDFTDSKVNLLLILGTLAGVILLIAIVYFFTRMKARQTSSSHENSQRPDATYTDLVKKEVSSDYDALKPSFPPAARRRDSPSDNHYENLQRK